MINLTGKNVRNADAVDSLTAHAGYKYAVLVENLKSGVIGRNIELPASAGDLDRKLIDCRCRIFQPQTFPDGVVDLESRLAAWYSRRLHSVLRNHRHKHARFGVGSRRSA
jgi:hypothetical protein